MERYSTTSENLSNLTSFSSTSPQQMSSSPQQTARRMSQATVHSQVSFGMNDTARSNTSQQKLKSNGQKQSSAPSVASGYHHHQPRNSTVSNYQVAIAPQFNNATAANNLNEYPAATIRGALVLHQQREAAAQAEAATAADPNPLAEVLPEGHHIPDFQRVPIIPMPSFGAGGPPSSSSSNAVSSNPWRARVSFIVRVALAIVVFVLSIVVSVQISNTKDGIVAAKLKMTEACGSATLLASSTSASTSPM